MPRTKLIELPIHQQPDRLTAKQAAILGVIVAQGDGPGLNLGEIRQAIVRHGLSVRRTEIWAIVQRLRTLGVVAFVDRSQELAGQADPRQRIWVIPTGPGRLTAHAWARLFAPIIETMQLPTPEEKKRANTRPKPPARRGGNRRQK